MCVSQDLSSRWTNSAALGGNSTVPVGLPSASTSEPTRSSAASGRQLNAKTSPIAISLLIRNDGALRSE
jgi:hypothetical protein